MPLFPRVVCIENEDPFENLALEIALLDGLDGDESFLLWYRNRPSVVVGIFQNPWLECDPVFLETNDVKLVRRISGGGAVYHDLGNVNWAFIGPRRGFSKEDNHRHILDVLGAIGVEADLNHRGDLTCMGKKISGNAFCHRKTRSLHHGTLLFDPDLDLLRSCLRPDVSVSETTRSSNAVSSVRSEVLALANVLPGFDSGSFFRRVCEISCERLGTQFHEMSPKELVAETSARISLEPGELSSWEYRLGKTPGFKVLDKQGGEHEICNGFLVGYRDSGGRFRPATRQKFECYESLPTYAG